MSSNIRYVQGTPSFEVLTQEEVKNHLRIVLEDSSEDDLIDTWIKAAREKAETYLRMALSTRNIDIYLDTFDTEIELNIYPIQSVTYVKYYDGDNALQTMSASNYLTDLVSDLARVEFINIPTTYDKYNAVNIRVVAGYTAAANVPQQIKQAMLIFISHFDQNRELLAEKQLYEIPNSAKWLLDDFRKFVFK
jgi:uncharacterized phiE125 gp8 family phage protein